jgi:hypothetical protein
MKNSKLDLIQSISEQQQKAEQLQTSLQQLSQTLINFEQLIEQSEKPIINSTTLLHNVQQTTTALESHLRSILIEIKNLSPQAIQTLTTSYTEQIQVLQAQLCNIDISSIETVTTSIDSFSTSIQALQEEINSQLGNITIDQESLQQSIQDQVQQAIANQSEQFQNDIQTLITEKLSEQRSKYILGDDRFWTADSFNRFISGLSNQYKSEDHRSTARSHSTEHTTNFKSNQNLESIAEISNADRNRPFLKEQNDLLSQQNNLLAEQNNALNQQVSSLKSILSKYSEVEQSLQNKISNLKREKKPSRP